MHAVSADCCAAAASHLERRAGQLPHMASLIVCPPTLVAHWPHEIQKFVGSGQVSIVQASDSAARLMHMSHAHAGLHASPHHAGPASVWHACLRAAICA